MFYEKRLIESLEKKFSLKENIESVYKNCQIIENEDGLYSIIYKGIEVADNFKNIKSAKVAIDQEMETWPNDPWGQGMLDENLNINENIKDDIKKEKVYQDVKKFLFDEIKYSIQNMFQVWDIEDKVPEYNVEWCSEIPVLPQDADDRYISAIADNICKALFYYYK